MNEAQRAAIRRYLDERLRVDDLGGEVADLEERVELSAGGREAREEEALNRRALELSAAHGMDYDQALGFAVDERPEIPRRKHNGRDPTDEHKLNARAELLMSQEGIDYEEALMLAAEAEGGTLDAV